MVHEHHNANYWTVKHDIEQSAACIVSLSLSWHCSAIMFMNQLAHLRTLAHYIFSTSGPFAPLISQALFSAVPSVVSVSPCLLCYAIKIFQALDFSGLCGIMLEFLLKR